jgi:outer membrane protein assembly factor BamB
MRIRRKSAKLTAPILLVLLMASVILMANVSVKAQEGSHGGTPATSYTFSTTVPAGVTVNWTFHPVVYLSFTPNPVGVGQTILVNMWTTPPPAADRYLQGFTVTITKPNNETDIVGPMNSYVADGTAWFEYVVNQVGTWKLKFSFPGQYFPGGRYSNGVPSTSGGSRYDAMYYTPASTAEQELVVQNEQVLSWSSPLPTDYWTRPISLENREWYTIGGNYPWMKWNPGGMMLGAPRYMGPYITAPNTAHILWKRQDAIAGLIGGEAGQYGIVGSVGTPSVIYAGRCYQTLTIPVNGIMTSCAVCYDLRTGQQYYAIPTSQGGVTPSFLNIYKGAAFGVVAGATESGTYTVDLIAISGSGNNVRMLKINPYTGAVTTNVSAMAAAVVSFGTISGAYYNGYVLSVQSNRLINWSTAGSSSNFASRIVSNISYPFTSLGCTDFETGVTVNQGRFVFGSVDGGLITAVSLTTGQVLWNKTTTDTPFTPGTCVADDGKYFCCMENRYWKAYDLLTGKELWKSDLTSYPWGDFWGYYTSSAYGMIYTYCYDGVYAFDWDTGKTVWHYSYPAIAYENPYTLNGSSVYPFTGSGEVADGKFYIRNNEHTPTMPATRGWKLHCINVTTGEGLWNITGGMEPGAAADGYLTAGNSYDGYMYVFGKGKSATTVSAPQTAVTLGQSIVITGAVTDQSPAQPGTACVSKESMATYMEYLHMQKPIPAGVTVTGVPVSLDVVDSNGNPTHIGDVTTDMSGAFGFMWKPEITGKYTITATFKGDDSYGSSFATTYAGVVAAPEATPTPPPKEAPDYMPMMYAILVAVIIAIIIGLIALFRKR